MLPLRRTNHQKACFKDLGSLVVYQHNPSFNRHQMWKFNAGTMDIVSFQAQSESGNMAVIITREKHHDVHLNVLSR